MIFQFEMEWLARIREFSNKIGPRFCKIQGTVLNASDFLSAQIIPQVGESKFYHITVTTRSKPQFTVEYKIREEAESALDQLFKDLK